MTKEKFQSLLLIYPKFENAKNIYNGLHTKCHINSAASLPYTDSKFLLLVFNLHEKDILIYRYPAHQGKNALCCASAQNYAESDIGSVRKDASGQA